MKNAFWIFILALLILLFFLPSYSRMQDMRQKNIRYSKQVEALSEENKRLIAEKKRLIEDPEYLEAVAREKMGLVRDGEVVYKLMPANVVDE